MYTDNPSPFTTHPRPLLSYPHSATSYIIPYVPLASLRRSIRSHVARRNYQDARHPDQHLDRAGVRGQDDD